LISFRQLEYNRQGHFWIALQITHDHFTSNKDHPGARFKSNAMSPFHSPSCQGSSTWISQQFHIRRLYRCPSKVYCTKEKMFKFVFWQWDNIRYISSLTSGTQETFCVRGTSVKTYGIRKFRTIYVAFYSTTLATVGGLWEAGVRCMKYHLKRLVGVTAITFEVRTLMTQAQACLNSRPLNSFSMSQMTSSTLVQETSWLVHLVHVLLSLTCLICQPSV
jgi:hypothetical protein